MILTLTLMLNEYKLSQEVNDFNIKQTNKNTLTKTISDLRIFQAFCNEPEIVIVPVSRKCTKMRRW